MIEFFISVLFFAVLVLAVREGYKHDMEKYYVENYGDDTERELRKTESVYE